ncbi:MAG TPA: GLUG motif-containing protein [Rhizomicrobium sp.]|nr:GLUG motif-containing protein [Rhizomicrobium sp.]
MNRFALAALALLLAGGARAETVISSAPTAHMSCSDGTCTPTAKNAVLNASDLQGMLAAGDVTVATGAGAKSIAVEAPIAWASTHTLTLHPDLNVNVKAVIAVEGGGGLNIAPFVGGDLVMFPTGRIDFWDTDSSLTIAGAPYTLIADLPTFQQLIQEHAGGGWYALTKDYDAAGDGTYQNSVYWKLTAVFNGLNHTIANLNVAYESDSNNGFIGYNYGTIRDVRFANAHVSGGHAGIAAGTTVGPIVNVSTSGTVEGLDAGGVVGYVDDTFERGTTITRSSSSANVTGGRECMIGGLVGGGYQITISYSHASGTVSPGAHAMAGGLAGFATNVVQSYATGHVAPTALYAYERLGGLLGATPYSQSNVVDSYATGQVDGPGRQSEAGGLIGSASGSSVRTSYATGLVTGSKDDPRLKHKVGRWGGFSGRDRTGQNSDDYWDVDTSGRDSACGNKCSGITGLSDAALKSGLPAGFDRKVWAQDPSINNGYPYLLKNPPE